MDGYFDDFVVGLPVSHCKLHTKFYNAILIAINWYTKQVHYFLCHHTLKAFGLAAILNRKLVL
jgi:hypothetical protein